MITDQILPPIDTTRAVGALGLPAILLSAAGQGALLRDGRETTSDDPHTTATTRAV